MANNMYKNLTITDYEDLDELAEIFDNVVETLQDNDWGDYNSVSVYAKGATISELLKILLTGYDYEIGLIDLATDPYNDDYKGEYSLTVYDGKLICIEKARHGDNYSEFYEIEDIVFFYQEDCDQDLIDNALKNDAAVTLFGLEGDLECCDCCDCAGEDECELAAKKEESGISVKVNGKEITDEKEKLDALKEFIDKYKETEREFRRIRDSFWF